MLRIFVFINMTILKGMDELFWGKELEDVFDWAKKLHMAVEVHEYDREKLFKIY